jgi:hypothetical protein
MRTKGIGPNNLGISPLKRKLEDGSEDPRTRKERIRDRRQGNELISSYRAGDSQGIAMDPVRVQRKSTRRVVDDGAASSSGYVIQNRMDNMKTGEASYGKTIDTKEADGTTKLVRSRSTPGKGGEMKVTSSDNPGTTYVGWDKDMNLTRNGEPTRYIDPIELGDLAESSANEFFSASPGKMLKKSPFKMKGSIYKK